MECMTIIQILLSAATLTSCLVDPIVLVHGGADALHELRVEARKEGVKKAAMQGYKILKKGGSVIDAVEQAIRVMEEDENFNAGYGSVLNLDGEVEMDAGIMVGSNLSSGAVTNIKFVAHPISLARMVMERSPHFMLAGDGAKRFARDQKVPIINNKALITKLAIEDLQKYKLQVQGNWSSSTGGGCGGVGAIAIDSKGRLAAAASTGGSLGKMVGRTSDVSTIGSGLYVDDETGAVAVTGSGEAIARYVLAHEIISNMRRGFEAGVATRNSVKGITQKFHKFTGAISLSKTGAIGISFTTDKMAWAYQLRDDVHYGVDDYDHFTEKISI